MVGMYWQQLSALAAENTAAGLSNTGPGTPASTLCSFPLPDQSLGYLFLIEWFVCSYIVSVAPFLHLYMQLTRPIQGIVIWTCLDPANPFITPAVAPFAIGLVYGANVMIELSSHHVIAC